MALEAGAEGGEAIAEEVDFVAGGLEEGPDGFVQEQVAQGLRGECGPSARR